jgi:hypothetical protein
VSPTNLLNQTGTADRIASVRTMSIDRSSQPFRTVLETELGHIRTRRRRLFPRRTAVAGDERDPHVAKALGLAFSGGGIRSATFNLGLLQGLAELGLLKYVDYLSTVSGGGYIGSWLHGVIRNHFKGDPDRAAALLSPRRHTTPRPPQRDPISFLRKFSNYLAPKPGLFSTDSWVIGFIWLRNVLLNQLILLPALVAVILSALLLVFLQQILATTPWWPAVKFPTLIAIAFGTLGLAAIVIWKNLDLVVRQTFLKPDETTTVREADQAWEHRSLVVVPCVFIASIALAFAANLPRYSARFTVFVGLVLLFALAQLSGGFMRCYVHAHGDRNGDRSEQRKRGASTAASVLAIAHVIWMVTAAAAFSWGLVIGVWHLTGHLPPWDRVAFAPPLVSLSLIAGTSLHLGLMGSDYADGAREWIARAGSMLWLTCAGWIALFVIAVHAPRWIAWLLGEHGPTGLTMIGGWAATTLAGVLAGRSGRDNGREQPTKGRSLGLLTGAAPTVFLLGYLLLLSYAAHAALVIVSPLPAPSSVAPETPANRVTVDVRVPETAPGIQIDVRGPQTKGWLETNLEPLARFGEGYYDVLWLTDGPGSNRYARPLWLLALSFGCLTVTWIASLRINITEFSLHHFYKNRLVRCYLGASRSANRKPNPLTGFDPADDFPISALLPDASLAYHGPYAIVNATLNLNAGSELAQQERKAASFVFTPAFCGFAPSRSGEDTYAVGHTSGLDKYGYRPTKGYGFPAGPALGTTVAISGAAASPNSGYSTSGPMAFLLTVFDARLGWWLGNPRWRDASRRPGPAFALWYLLAELLGQTTARSKFVNLSDGGHFDNLGLYELVRRRCRYIIIGDGEQDGDLTFGSLGGAIRKCRADFGVEIDIDPDPIRIVDGFSRAHCVVGTITYPERDTGTPVSIGGDRAQPITDKARGWILYLKSSLTGDEPADVIEYRSRNPTFPHQSTSDQFFSESQFESYRRLGLHIVRDALEGVPRQLAIGDSAELVSLFQALTRKWYAPIPVNADAASRLAADYSSLMRRLSEDMDLVDLLPELVADFGSPGRAAPRLNDASAMFLVEVIQLIENVYTEFRFEHAANRANPRNAGWMTVFRRWVNSPLLYGQVWQRVQGDYNPLFQQFMNDHLRRTGVEDVPMRS